jgi:N-methylhydantoinase B
MTNSILSRAGAPIPASSASAASLASSSSPRSLSTSSVTLAATASSTTSPNIKERRDFSCAVFDGDGRLLAQAAHIPVHLGAMPASVEAARAAVATWHPGDVVVSNDPFAGGSHLPDITSVSPVFVDSRPTPALFVATRAHHADVGGLTPGSLGMAYDLYGEGLIIPPIKLAEGGRVSNDVLSLICANSRTGSERRGDLEAQLAAHRIGSQRLHEMVDPDPDGFAAQARALLEYSSRRTRAALARLRPGRYTFEDFLEGDGHREEDLLLCVTLEVSSDRLVADFAGTSAQVRGGVNMPLAVTRSAVYYVVACLVGDVPINDGVFRCVDVVAPRGSLVNPEPGAAVVAGNVETSQRAVDALLGALAGAAPDRVPAASQGTMNNVTIGGLDPRSGAPFTYYETTAGGTGGGPLRPGADALQVHMTNTRNTPVEALETAYPMRIESVAVRRRSGGDGRHPGGDGVVRRIRLLAPCRLTLVAERHRHAPWGLAGGCPGRVGIARLSSGTRSRRLGAKASLEVEAGGVLTLETPGGGGWGEPSAEHSR